MSSLTPARSASRCVPDQSIGRRLIFRVNNGFLKTWLDILQVEKKFLSNISFFLKKYLKYLKLFGLYGFDKKLDQIGFFLLKKGKISLLIWNPIIDFKFVSRNLSTKDVAYSFSKIFDTKEETNSYHDLNHD